MRGQLPGIERLGWLFRRAPKPSPDDRLFEPPGWLGSSASCSVVGDAIAASAGAVVSAAAVFLLLLWIVGTRVILDFKRAGHTLA